MRSFDHGSLGGAGVLIPGSITVVSLRAKIHNMVFEL